MTSSTEPPLRLPLAAEAGHAEIVIWHHIKSLEPVPSRNSMCTVGHNVVDDLRIGTNEAVFSTSL